MAQTVKPTADHAILPTHSLTGYVVDQARIREALGLNSDQSAPPPVFAVPPPFAAYSSPFGPAPDAQAKTYRW